VRLDECLELVGAGHEKVRLGLCAYEDGLCTLGCR
jgi:hypothetical protein